MREFGELNEITKARAMTLLNQLLETGRVTRRRGRVNGAVGYWYTIVN